MARGQSLGYTNKQSIYAEEVRCLVPHKLHIQDGFEERTSCDLAASVLFQKIGSDPRWDYVYNLHMYGG